MVLVGLVVVANRMLVEWSTRVEAVASARIADFAGLRGVWEIPGSNLVRGLHQGQAYAIRVTESCSALTAFAAFFGLSVLVFRGPRWRRAVIGVLAGAVVVAGNLSRVAGLLWVGNHRGVADLVAVHDWIATLYSWAYLLGGFVTLVGLHMSSIRRWRDDPPFTFGL